MLPVFEQGNTILFSWPNSFQPDVPPHLSVIEPFGLTAIHSETARGEPILTGGMFWSLVVVPNTPGVYMFEWLAQRTLVSSTYNFIDRGTFKVHQTLAGGFGG